MVDVPMQKSNTNYGWHRTQMTLEKRGKRKTWEDAAQKTIEDNDEPKRVHRNLRDLHI